jgi:glucoamylase
MADLKNNFPASGGPGIPPRWTRSAKDGIGTSYFAGSKVWFTISSGIVNEVYYPTIDHPQIRDLQFLFTDGKSFFVDERHLSRTKTEYLQEHVLGMKLINSDPKGNFQIEKEVIVNPHQSVLLIHTKLSGSSQTLKNLHVFSLLAPHLEIGGWGNNGYVCEVSGREILVANKGITWLAFGGTIPFLKRSCGYVGMTDGWQDLKKNMQMDWQFDSAENGNIALTGELDLSEHKEFTLALAFGHNLEAAVTQLFQSLGVTYEELRERFVEQWVRAVNHVIPLKQFSHDQGKLYSTSHSLLLAHEDKTYPGAMIASLSIPWGEAKGDEDLGGYHLVWTRDMVNSASALLASGNLSTPLRSLIYLACTQESDGGFYQNFWINGEPYWKGVQLDESAFPIILAWKLKQENGLKNFDPYHVILSGAKYLITKGPCTPQERWEENSGYSPSTLAANIASLFCASEFAREKGDLKTAQFILEYADFLECHIEDWTVTTQGTLVRGIPKHYIRILPVSPEDSRPLEDPNQGTLPIRNRAPGKQWEFPAKEVVDPGFLELVRYGIRKPGDPIIEDSLKVIDAILKVETPYGSCWRRYNHDGYGQREDGGPYTGTGRGRAWPLLTGERGHYELACGRDVNPYIKAIEGFSSATGLLPEQVWDEKDKPRLKLFLGRPTGSAMPLMWAHAEYIKLLRSVRDKQVYDFIPLIAERYWKNKKPNSLEVWKFNRQPKSVQKGTTLRILAEAAFTLHWSKDGWITCYDSRSSSTALGIDYLDIPTTRNQNSPILFTFFWTNANHWEGKNFKVDVV